MKELPPIITLPTEILHHILSYLDPYSLADVLGTCRALHFLASYDELWHDILSEHLPNSVLATPSPFESFRKLFAAYHPYWFIPRSKIRFNDNAAFGGILLARFNRREGCIQAFPLHAERASQGFQFWSQDPLVGLDFFFPRVTIDLQNVILELNNRSGYHRNGNVLQKEIDMGDHTRVPEWLMLARALSPSLIGPGTQVWPPVNLPARDRTRNTSVENFRGIGHRPEKMSEVSKSAFRIRMRRPGGPVNTYGTLPEESYTPTKRKPWQGIWVGDYSVHGCEFLLITQPDRPGPLPHNFYPLDFGSPSTEAAEGSETGDVMLDMLAMVQEDTVADAPLVDEPQLPPPQDCEASRRSTDAFPACGDDLIYEGRLEAIKLTGDPHIPRGEYTFIAPDIGDAGLIRFADEEVFKGARIVRSRGHVAQRPFQDDSYISSQLIFVSPNKIAQHWEDFRHVSMYERVNIDDLIDVDEEMITKDYVYTLH